MIRVRRVPPGRFHRRAYEVELTEPNAAAPTWTRVTRTPVTLIDPYLGVGDAWAVVKAADRAWDGRSGDWVSMFHGPQ